MAKMKKAQSGTMAKSLNKTSIFGKNYTPATAKEKAQGAKQAAGMKKKADAGKPFKMGGKAQNGKEFGMLSVKAGIDKNPNPTFADKIAGAKKKATSGTSMMEMGGKAPKKKMRNGGSSTVSMQLGSYDRQIGKNYTGKAMNGKMMKGGGKCKNGC
jgi:hypothetical protein